ncbi:MAG: ABC transporter ATP-binding protein [Chlamydiota bacterium]
MKKQTLFSLKNTWFFYRLGAKKVPALQGISLDVPAEALVTVSGPSGSGKSTLLHLLGLIEPAQEGELSFLGEDVKRFSKKKQNLIRKNELGFVFQRFHLIPVLNVEENVAYFLIRMGLSREEVKKRTKEALVWVGLYEHRNKRPFQLSGGQRQRVAIARAIAKKPAVVLADEPTANLDQKTGKQIMQILRRMVDEKHLSVVISTHDPMVLSFADHKIEMCDGQLINKES